MEPVFDRAGETIAWRFRDILYDMAGNGVGFVRNHAIYTRAGRYIGPCEDGLYRDATGAVLAFERDATGGPLLPAPGPLPVAPKPELRPAEPAFQPTPRPPMRKLAWSAQTWDSLLA